MACTASQTPKPLSRDTDAALIAEIRTSGWLSATNGAGSACSITVTENPCCASPSASAPPTIPPPTMAISVG